MVARTKKTVRLEGQGSPFVYATIGKRSKKGKPHCLFKKKTHRVSSNANALREISKAQRVTFLFILKAPFKTLVKEIINQCVSNLRLYTTNLDCL